MKHFLLLDDDNIFNFLTAKKIQLSGFKGKIDIFTVADDLLKYLKDLRVENTKMKYAILLDIRMPGVSGFQFLDEMITLPENVLKNTKVFVLTSSIDRRDYEKAFSYPFVDGFFSKPLDTAAITKMLAAYD